ARADPAAGRGAAGRGTGGRPGPRPRLGAGHRRPQRPRRRHHLDDAVLPGDTPEPPGAGDDDHVEAARVEAGRVEAVEPESAPHHDDHDEVLGFDRIDVEVGRDHDDDDPSEVDDADDDPEAEVLGRYVVAVELVHDHDHHNHREAGTAAEVGV